MSVISFLFLLLSSVAVTSNACAPAAKEGGLSWRNNDGCSPSDCDGESEREILMVDSAANSLSATPAFTSIQAAVESASEHGALIVVAPGTYPENGRLVVNKEIEIVGAPGTGRKVFVDAALEFTGLKGRVANLNFRHMTGDTKALGCVELLQGTKVVIEDCDVEGSVVVADGSNPTVRLNRIHASEHHGLIVEGRGSTGLISGNDLTGHARCGVVIKDTANPVVRNNLCNDNKMAGIAIGDSGRGVVESNQVLLCGLCALDGWCRSTDLILLQFEGNAFYGMAVGSNAHSMIRRNECSGNRQGGIMVSGESDVELRSNTLSHNTGSGLTVTGNANLHAVGNRAHNNTEAGILVGGTGQAKIEKNRMYNNEGPGLRVEDSADPTVRKNKMKVNRQDGIQIGDTARGTIEENTMSFNSMSGMLAMLFHPRCSSLMLCLNRLQALHNPLAGIEVSDTATTVMQKNTSKQNSGAGIMISGSSTAVIRSNDVTGNEQQGLMVQDDAKPQISANAVHGNRMSGIHVQQRADAEIMDNSVHSNMKSGISMEDNATAIIHNNFLHSNARAGIRMGGTGQATVEHNRMFNNAGPGMKIRDAAVPTVRYNKMEVRGCRDPTEP